MAHNILENPWKQKCGIITMLVSSVIGLVYESISSFLHPKQNKGLLRQLRLWIIRPLSSTTN